MKTGKFGNSTARNLNRKRVLMKYVSLYCSSVSERSVTSLDTADSDIPHCSSGIKPGSVHFRNHISRSVIPTISEMVWKSELEELRRKDYHPPSKICKKIFPPYILSKKIADPYSFDEPISDDEDW